jgi:quinol-cytochrome oxidoreductase complex cytochrome b subunit
VTESEKTAPEEVERPSVPARVLRWLEKATDVRILGIPRMFGLIYGRMQDSDSIGDAWRKAMRRRLSPNVGWKHAFGGTTYFLCMILVVTGVMLSFYYRPSAVEAYPSLQYLETEVGFGWLVRHVHYWAASLVVLTVLAHLFRVLYTGTYRAPRETTWLIGILLLLTLLAFVTSGYLLPWDQWAYWTSTTGVEQLEGFPLVGGLVAGLFRADEFVSGATLSRFYATHVILLPWVALLLLSLHFQLIRKHGVAREGDVAEGEGEPFFPNHMLRQLAVALLTTGVLVTLAAFLPRPFGPPANPFEVPGDIPALGLPAAILVGAARLPGGLGLYGLPILLVVLSVLPLVERSNERSLVRRPLALALFVLFFLLLLSSFLAGIGLWGGGSGGGG